MLAALQIVHYNCPQNRPKNYSGNSPQNCPLDCTKAAANILNEKTMFCFVFKSYLDGGYGLAIFLEIVHSL